MDRREALKNASLILGYVITTSTAIAVLNGCKPDVSQDWIPEYLTVDEIDLIKIVSEIIIPRTETPGANDVKADRFIDAIQGSWSPEKRKMFSTDLLKFDEASNLRFQKSFDRCNAIQRIEIIDAMVQESRDSEQGHIFKTLRELTVVAFCTSEIGATEFLNYPTPIAPFEGCIDFSLVGKTYAF